MTALTKLAGWADRMLDLLERALFKDAVRMTEWTALFVLYAWFDELRWNPAIVERPVYAEFANLGAPVWSTVSGTIAFGLIVGMLPLGRMQAVIRALMLGAACFFLMFVALTFSASGIGTTATRVYLAIGFACFWSTARVVARI